MRSRASCLVVCLMLACRGGGGQRDTTQLDTTDSGDTHSSSEAEASSSEGESESEGEGETGTPQGVVLSFLMADLVSGATVPEVDACVVDRPDFPCVQADADGALEIEVPIGEEVVIRFIKPPNQVPANEHALHFEDQSLTRYTMITETSLELFRGLVGIENEPNTGTIIGIASPGVSLSLEPEAGFGPIYLDDNLLPNLELTATTGNGGWGFANVPPGEYEVRFSAEGQECVGVGSWSGDTPGSHGITVIANELSTSGLITCE